MKLTTCDSFRDLDEMVSRYSPFFPKTKASKPVDRGASHVGGRGAGAGAFT